MFDAHRQPTITRLHASMMKQTYATPCQVGTNVTSVTHNWFGAAALKTRFTKSGCLGIFGSGFVVLNLFSRRTPQYREHSSAWPRGRGRSRYLPAGQHSRVSAPRRWSSSLSRGQIVAARFPHLGAAWLMPAYRSRRHTWTGPPAILCRCARPRDDDQQQHLPYSG